VAKPPRHPDKKTTVILHQASYVELTKRGANNSLNIEVRHGSELLGNFVVGRGSVQWWPNGNRANCFKRPWPSFAKLLEREMAQ
jgi:hypothetical protein